jgi:hypothetical protein
MSRGFIEIVIRPIASDKPFTSPVRYCLYPEWEHTHTLLPNMLLTPARPLQHQSLCFCRRSNVCKPNRPSAFDEETELMIESVLSLAGRLTAGWLLLTHGSYRGAGIIKVRSQVSSRSPVDRLLRAALRAHLKRRLVLRKLEDGFDFANRNEPRDRPTDLAIAQYCNDDASGYGATHFALGGADIHTQQRGILLPLLENALSTRNDADTIVEIGTGNGDVIAYLAEKFPALQFVGLDFSVTNASKKHGHIANLRFESGYALDALPRLSPAVAFASSTTVVMPGPELNRYISTLAAIGCATVILNEPSWFGISAQPLYERRTVHLEGAVWFHDYRAYLNNNGYHVTSFATNHYKSPGSNRPDVVVTLLQADLNGKA